VFSTQSGRERALRRAEVGVVLGLTARAPPAPCRMFPSGAFRPFTASPSTDAFTGVGRYGREAATLNMLVTKGTGLGAVHVHTFHQIHPRPDEERGPHDQSIKGFDY